MEILFENSYTRTQQHAKEIYRYFYYKRPLYIVSDVMVGISFLVNIVLYLTDPYDYNIVVLICIPLFFLFQFLLYSSAVKTMVQRDSEAANGNTVHVDTIVTEDQLQCTASNGSVMKASYSNIKKVIQTKNLILLRSKANFIYIFPKSGFTKGTADEFLTFLKQKGIKG